MARSMTTDDFLQLGLEIAGYDRWQYTERKKNEFNFKDTYGATALTCHEMWSDMRRKNMLSKNAKPMHLLLALRFMYTNDKETELCRFFRIRSTTTIEVRVKEFYNYIALLLEEKMLSWEEADDGMIYFMSVDGTHCPISEPKPFSTIWSSHKFGGKAALNYEIGVLISRPKLVWIYGPTPPGAKNDLQVAEEELIPALREYGGVMAVADGIYGAQEVSDVISTKNVYDPWEVEDFKNRVSARMEGFNGLLKIWKVLSTRFRLPLDEHPTVFNAVAAVTCYQLDNGSYHLFDPYPVYD